MSDPSAARPVRKVAVADHIWNAYELMAQEMGSERDALINQAMFMFARLNGFLEVGARATVPADIAEPAAAPAARARPAPAPEPEPEHAFDEPAHGDEGAEEEQHEAAAEEEEPLEDEQAAEAHDEGGGYEEPADPTPLPAPAPTPPPRRNMPSGVRPPPRAEAGEPPVVEPRRRMTELAPSIDGFDGPPAAKLDDDPVRREVAERVLETAAELERLIKGKQQGGAEPRNDAAGPSASADKGLYLVLENGDTEKVAKDRYLIGRGKHCDFVINSGKVSREHAAILRDGAEYFIEDLGSSNGTWYNKARIKRRKVEDGDEYFICSEKIKFVVR